MRPDVLGSRRWRGVAGVVAAATLAVPAAAQLSAPDMLSLADRAAAAQRTNEAEAIWHALMQDPDVEIRTEARFRLAMMRIDQRHLRDAAILFRAILDEKPDANRVRLELARVLALMGDEDAARRQLRHAQSAGLPPDVAITVERFANALRTTKRLGGSFEVAFVPDSNINRATRATTLDTVIAPLTLDDDARAKSGLGVKASGESYARLPVADGTALLLRGFGSATLYGDKSFNDVSVGASTGPEWRSGGERVRPAIGIGRRYYGGDLYARTTSATINWLHPVGQRDQIVTELSASWARYPVNRLQDGAIYDGSIGFEHGFSPRTGTSLTLFANRQTARDRGYATASGGASLLVWRDAGTATLHATATWRRLEADARLALFLRRRIDDYARIGVGASFRKLAVVGIAPIVRVAYERNRSTVGLYAYRRLAVDVGVIRAF